jgi:hypothetical protein
MLEKVNKDEVKRCPYVSTRNALWISRYRCRQDEPGWLSLQFRVAGLSWPLELLGRLDRNTVGFWSFNGERAG